MSRVSGMLSLLVQAAMLLAMLAHGSCAGTFSLTPAQTTCITATIGVTTLSGQVVTGDSVSAYTPSQVAATPCSKVGDTCSNAGINGVIVANTSVVFKGLAPSTTYTVVYVNSNFVAQSNAINITTPSAANCGFNVSLSLLSSSCFSASVAYTNPNGAYPLDVTADTLQVFPMPAGCANVGDVCTGQATQTLPIKLSSTPTNNALNGSSTIVFRTSGAASYLVTLSSGSSNVIVASLLVNVSSCGSAASVTPYTVALASATCLSASVSFSLLYNTYTTQYDSLFLYSNATAANCSVPGSVCSPSSLLQSAVFSGMAMNAGNVNISGLTPGTTYTIFYGDSINTGTGSTPPVQFSNLLNFTTPSTCSNFAINLTSNPPCLSYAPSTSLSGSASFASVGYSTPTSQTNGDSIATVAPGTCGNVGSVCNVPAAYQNPITSNNVNSGSVGFRVSTDAGVDAQHYLVGVNSTFQLVYLVGSRVVGSYLNVTVSTACPSVTTPSPAPSVLPTVTVAPSTAAPTTTASPNSTNPTPAPTVPNQRSAASTSITHSFIYTILMFIMANCLKNIC